MKVTCKVCNGKGKVDKEFGMGKCKEIPGDPFNRVCPACDGTGMQEEKDSVSYPIWRIDTDPYKRRRKPCPDPLNPFIDPPWKSYPKKKRPIWVINSL